MTKEKFLKIYKEVISGYVEDLKQIDSDSGKNCLKFNERRALKMYDLYEKRRRYIRRYFMKRENQPMDRHKIGAVFMYAALKSRPFSVNRFIHNLPNQLLMANEYLAFYLGLTIVESYRLDKSENPDDLDAIKLLLPCTYHGKEKEQFGAEYIDNVCKALYYVRKPEHFDIFAYADILFLLEKYTDTIKENVNKRNKKSEDEGA